MDYNPKDFLLFALDHFNLPIQSAADKYIHLEKEYVIEIEGPKLFKLMHQGQVVAPFGDVEELCNFIKTDMALNEKD
jgi:hypothetical protein